MSPWCFNDRRGPEWRHGWLERALFSLSLPPPHLIVVFAIVMLFLSMSWSRDYKAQVRRTEAGFRFFLFLLPVALILVAPCVVRQAFVFRGRQEYEPELEQSRKRTSPWGVLDLVVVVLLLLMVSYQSSFQSQWFRPLWGME